MQEVVIRQAEVHDIPDLGIMRHDLWPDGSSADHARDAAALIATGASGPFPSILFVAESKDGRAIGFIEAGLRSNFVLADQHGNLLDVGHPVRCIAPESLVRFHTGYEADVNDDHDVRLLCERFGIALPAEYRKFDS